LAPCEEGLAVARRTGAKADEALMLSLKGSLQRKKGLPREAIEAHRGALALLEECHGSPIQRGEIFLEIFCDAADLKDRESAESALQEAERILSAGADFTAMTSLKGARARYELSFGDKSQAARLYEKLIASLKEKGHLLRAGELRKELEAGRGA
jgi:tetratricopeptide (TPR) repeat protein